MQSVFHENVRILDSLTRMEQIPFFANGLPKGKDAAAVGEDALWCSEQRTCCGLAYGADSVAGRGGLSWGQVVGVVDDGLTYCTTAAEETDVCYSCLLLVSSP